ATDADLARLSGTITGTSITDLLKTGKGVLELTGANTYAGNTIVAQGTLLVNNTSGSGTGTGTVIVRNTGTLGGTGTVSGPVGVRRGGRIAPGTVGATGTLTAGNGVRFESGSAFTVDVRGGTAGTGYDQLKVTSGNVVLSGDLTASFSGFSPDGTEKVW